MTKQKVFFGYYSYKNLSSIFKERSPRKVLLIAGQKSYALSGAEAMLGKIMEEVAVVRFKDYGPMPRLEDMERGVEFFRQQQCDFVLGVGGGATLDVAKAISLLATQNNSLEEILCKPDLLQPRKIPAVMMPTTAGTGSEATRFSVVYKDKVKFSLEHDSLLPDFAIVDPMFTLSLPPYVTACTGMDALCQAIESFWSVCSTEESRIWSKEAIELAIATIVSVVLTPNEKSRSDMLWASHLAGKAINIAKTTGAHAVSYPLTSYYQIPHGHAVALTLPSFVEFNDDVTVENVQDARGVPFVQCRMRELLDLLGVSTAAKAKEKIMRLMGKIQLETSLSKLGVNQKGLEIVVGGFSPDRMGNNPKKVSPEDVRRLLQSVLE